MGRRVSLLHAIGAVALAMSATSCAGDSERAAQQFREEPVADLYNTGLDLLDRRRWPDAARAFEEVERQHPYSPWARRAILMGAYAQYQSHQYEKTIQAAQRFISLHPGNESAPYAYYLIAICYFEQILDVGRDQATTELALRSLQELVRRFPDSDYARDARLKIDMTYDQLAGKEMEIGRFYLNQHQTLAAMNRFRRVVEEENFQRTSHVPEALHRLVESYLTVGMTEEAQRAAAVLGHNFPGSDWYQRTYALMEARGVQQVDEPEARRRGWFERTIGRLFD